MEKFIEKLIERLKEKQADIWGNESLHHFYSEGFGNGIDYAIDKINELAEEYFADTPQKSAGGWIPCSERLPKKVDFVLYTHKDGDVDICSIEYFYNYLDKFIAWQPLPEPYNEGGQK